VSERLVVVRGGGDLGSGVALRLWRAGFDIAILETPNPVAVRRTVAFAEAVYDGEAGVEEAVAELIASAADVPGVCGLGRLAVLIDPAAESLETIRPYAVVDAIMAKRNTGTARSMAHFVVGLGPGFGAGLDVHAVVETNRGPHLGRVIWRGAAEADTGEPGEVGGRRASRVLCAPAAGRLHALHSIGDIVEKGTIVAEVAGTPIRAPFPAVVRGLARDGLIVRAGMKVGDLDPRLDPGLCRLVSDKALAVAGGVLEAIMMSLRGASP